MPYPTDNIYTSLHQKLVKLIINDNSKIVTAWFRLTPRDILNLSLSDTIYLKGQAFIINKVIDYNLTGLGLTKVELIQLVEIDELSQWLPAPLEVDMAVVGGGGSGGAQHSGWAFGGGGGAGGALEDNRFLTDGDYTITVGTGGAGVTSGQGNDGTLSRFYREDYIDYIAGGGGGAGGVSPDSNAHHIWNGRNAPAIAAAAGRMVAGGSGGGGSRTTSLTGAGSDNNGIAGQGAVGNYSTGTRGGGYDFGGGANYTIGGGGGAGQNGNTITSTAQQSSIAAGLNWVGYTTYAAGGRSGELTEQYLSFNRSQAATPGCGGNASQAMKQGGSNPPSNPGRDGVCVIRYVGEPRATGGTITQFDGYTYHTFTENGTFTI